MGSFFQKFAKKRLAELVLRENPLYYRPMRRFFARMESASCGERQATMAKRLENVLRRATQFPAYRDTALAGDFRAFPILEKKDLRDRPDDYVSGSGRSGLFPTIAAETGGTSGIPLKLRRTLSSIAVEQAALDHLSGRFGKQFGSARLAVLRGDVVKSAGDTDPPFWKYEAGGRKLVLSSHHLTRDTVDAYVRELVRFRPQVMWVYPSALNMLLNLMLERGLSLSIPLVMSSSEVFEEVTWRQTREILSSNILDYYGQAERVCLSYATNPGEYYFLPGYGIVELYHSHTEDDVGFYEIIGTGVWNSVQALIRYRTGDLAKLPADIDQKGIDEICCGVRPFLGVAGRTDDYLVTPEGRRIIGINHIPRGIPGVIQMQFVQKRTDEVTIRVVAKPDYDDNVAHKIIAQARTKIPVSVDLNIVRAEAPLKTERGKTPMVWRSVGV